jgi:ABC-2 type transport system ATP-binding protein
VEPLVIESLSKDYDGFRALDSLNLKVGTKSCTGFLGPNGAGKTTTIKILTSMLRATGGRAFLNGVDVTTDPKEALARVGAVVETPEFYPELTPIETLNYFAKLRGIPSDRAKARVMQVIDQVKMGEWKDRRIGKFSKGMKQRIAIAQALLHEPDLLVLDEPTAGLDPRGMAEVRDIIKALRIQGYTVFMSSHLLFEVQQLCDHIAVVDKGKLLIYDTVESLSTKRHVLKMEVDLVGKIDTETYAKVCALDKVKGVQCPTATKMLIDFDGDVADRRILLESLQRLGLQVYSFADAGVALEDFYLDLIKESK